jgi:predicted DNA-binding protein (MmcQ/YjbR family)
MDYVTARKYFLGKPEAGEDFPFYPDVAVFKVKGKMFATLSSEDGLARCNLKCDPDEAVMLRDIFDAVKPGYHMNKRHWNTVLLDGSIPAGELERMIDNSYALVVKKLTRVQRQALELQYRPEALYGLSK